MKIIRRCTNSQNLGRTYRADFFGREEEYKLCKQCRNYLSESGRENCLAQTSLKEWCQKWATSAIVVGCPAFRSNDTAIEEIRLGEFVKALPVHPLLPLQRFLRMLRKKWRTRARIFSFGASRYGPV